MVYQPPTERKTKERDGQPLIFLPVKAKGIKYAPISEKNLKENGKSLNLYLFLSLLNDKDDKRIKPNM